jgi:osmoprotectant transport system ATP-binding protein
VDATIPADRTLYDAFSQMLIHRANWVAVIDGDRLVGVLTPDAFLRAIRQVPAELEGAGAPAAS